MHILSRALAAAVLSAATLLACKDKSVDPVTDTYGQDTTAIAAYTKTQPQTYLYAGGGVRYAILTPNPSGRLPASGDEVEATYLLISLDGKYRVDSTKKDSVAYFRFNSGLLPSGIEIGLSKTREGEAATYLIPSYAAFQNTQFNNLPPNTPIRFNLTLRKLRTEDEQINDYIARNKLTVSTLTPEGVRICKTQTVANGSTLVSGQTVNVLYTGRYLRSGAVFDSNTGTGKQLFPVTLGAGSTIKGFEAGIRALKVGEKATVIFPSSQGYGTTGYSSIPGYMPLAFDIEVVSVK